MDEWLIPFFYLAVPITTFVLYRRMGPPQYRPQNRRTRRRQADPAVMEQINFGDNVMLPDPDELDKWEVLAIHWLHEGRELSAIELVQRQTGLDFEAAKIKLFKLEDEIDS